MGVLAPGSAHARLLRSADDLGTWHSLHVTVQWSVIPPAPALHVVDTTQCRGGLDHVLPGTVVDRVGDEAEVAHWGVVALESHLPGLTNTR